MSSSDQVGYLSLSSEGLTEHVKLLSNQLAWGLPMRRALSVFARHVKSWTAQAIAFLHLEVVDAGGGSAKMFIGLAEFSEKTAQLNRERKSQVRPYIIIPYIGAILIVVTTALMLYLLGGPGLQYSSGLAKPEVITATTTVLFTAAFFQAWTMGIVAGKMGELTVSDGFKHASLIVVISLVTAFLASQFVRF